MRTKRPARPGIWWVRRRLLPSLSPAGRNGRWRKSAGDRRTARSNFGNPQWPFVAAQVSAVFALASGFMTDLLATNLMHPGQINVIELPLVLLIVWNLAFFGWFFVKWVARLFKRGKQPIGPVIELIGKWRTSESLGFGGKRQRPWADSFKQDWSQLSGPLDTARLKMAASLASMLFTLGAVAHLIYRAAFDHYTGGWKTTLTSSIDRRCGAPHRQLDPGARFVFLADAVPGRPTDRELALAAEPLAKVQRTGSGCTSLPCWPGSSSPGFTWIALNGFVRWRMRLGLSLAP